MSHLGRLLLFCWAGNGEIDKLTHERRADKDPGKLTHARQTTQARADCWRVSREPVIEAAGRGVSTVTVDLLTTAKPSRRMKRGRSSVLVYCGVWGVWKGSHTRWLVFLLIALLGPVLCRFLIWGMDSRPGETEEQARLCSRLWRSDYTTCSERFTKRNYHFFFSSNHGLPVVKDLHNKLIIFFFFSNYGLPVVKDLHNKPIISSSLPIRFLGFYCWHFHKFSRQLSVFSLCSSSLISASVVLSTISLYESSSSALI